MMANAAESPKIHPVVDEEAQQRRTQSIPNETTATPHKGNPPANQPPPHRNLTTTQAVQRPSTAQAGPPPLPHPFSPAYRPNKTTSSFTCCRCICCTLCLILTLIVAIAVAGLILYLLFKPKVPTYSIDKLRITDLRLNTDLSLYAKFNVKITANNPNDKIGIYYEKGGDISVWYTDTELCSGPIPVFYQGHRNKTVLDVDLTGQNQYGQTLMTALQQQQQSGNVPLNLKVNAPVSVKLGGLKLRKVKIKVRCLLVVDSLSLNNMVSIRTSDCKVGVKL